MVRIRKVPDSFQSTEMDGELIMIGVDSGQFFALKGIGLEIWNALDSEPELGRICSTLEGQYDVGPEECSKSVKDFADQLIAAGFAEAF